jgi:hypothetical protein
MNSGSCAVDLEQWCSFRLPQILPCTNLTGVMWSIVAGLSTKGGGRLRYIKLGNKLNFTLRVSRNFNSIPIYIYICWLF